ncbi:MAG: hypothetical protein U0Q07_20485 [Acidimicrobiales bacterium]
MTAAAPLPTDRPGGPAPLAEVLWRRVPARASTVAPSLATVLADGAYLTRWPFASLVAPLAALVIGGFFGATHLTTPYTWTSSVLVIGLFVAVGSMGGALGAWLTVGYAITDLLLYRDGLIAVADGSDLLVLVLGRLVSYALLFLLVGFLPAALGRLTDPSSPIRNLPGRLVARAAVGGFVVFAYCFSIGPLIRPVFWLLATSPVDPISTAKDGAVVLAVVAAVAGAVRAVVETLAGDAADGPRLAGRKVGREVGIGVALLTALGASIGMTLVFSGFAEGVEQVVLLAVLVVVATGLRRVVLPRIDAYPPLVGRAPAWLRLGLTVAGGAALSWLFLSGPYAGYELISYRELVVSFGAGLLLAAFLLPDGSMGSREVAS